MVPIKGDEAEDAVATLVRKGSPALIPNVRFRVAGKYTKLEEEEKLKEHATR